MNIRTKVAELLGLNIVMWLIMLLLFAGLICCAGALYLALAPVLPVAVAALLAGVALLIVCGILAFMAWAAFRPSRESQPTRHEAKELDPVEDSVRAVVGDRAADWTRQNTELVVVGAVAVGAALAFSPKLRKAVMQMSGPVVGRAISSTVKNKIED